MAFSVNSSELDQPSNQWNWQPPDNLIPVSGEAGELELSALIDPRTLQSLMDDFHAVAHVPTAILDMKGRVLVGVGWQKVCLEFHRVHPLTCANCLESDLLLTQGVPTGEFRLYKCRNNMWDIATPILVGGRQVGNLFSGQFFFEDELPNYELFRAQAQKYGFDEDAYLTALDQVPRLSRETVNRTMSFFVKLAHMISLLSYSNLQLAQSLAEQDALMAALQKSEQRWATTLTSIGDGVIATDITGKVTFINRIAEELTGWSLSEAIQQPVEAVFQIIHEDTRQPVDQPVHKVLQTGAITGLANHTLLIRKDGSEIFIDDSGAPIQDDSGQILGVVLVFRDITQQRQAERQQAWLASFPQRNPNPILEISPDGQIAYANQKALELFPDLQKLGTNHAYLAGWQTVISQILCDPTLVIHRQVQVESRYYQQSIYYNQQYERIRAYGMDITERKLAEENVQKYAEELARSNQELQEFAYIASHDLNEPLRKIEMFGSVLTKDSSRMNERELDYLKRMMSGARRMRQMIDGLLSLSRVKTQEQPFVWVDWEKVLAEVLSDLETQLSRTGGRVEVCEMPRTQADPLQIHQLLQNLIGNALKYHRPEVPPQVKITCQEMKPNAVQIQVQDNGIGFDEKESARIFQPFQRLVGKSEYEGTGMGLAICRKIMDRHNGTITVSSAPGKGSTFIVTLPIHQQNEHECLQL